MLVFADLRRENKWTKFALETVLWRDTVSRGHVTFKPELVADLLRTNLALDSSMGVGDVSPQPGFCAEASSTLVTLERGVVLVL